MPAMRTPPTNTPTWASLDEAAEHLGVTTKTIRRYIARGILPAHRFGPRLIRVRLSDLDALVTPLTVAR